MSESYPEIPFEKQMDTQNSRACGAACLSMVYRSLGKAIPQTEIWPKVAKANRFGVVSSMAHLMALDATSRGFAAVAFQARHPLQVLRLCRDQGVRAIVNHRLRRDQPAGHYSVFLDIDGSSVVLHDPLLGPERRMTHAELLELWLPYFTDSEITGNMVIALAKSGAPPAPPCAFCKATVPSSIQCPRCKAAVGLEPGSVLGCINDMCISRMWNYLCCPSCDFVWTFRALPAQAGAAPGAPAQALAEPRGVRPAVDVEKVFGEVDKFRATILNIPAAASNPEITRMLDFMTGGKERFKLAVAEHESHVAAFQERVAAQKKAAKEQGDAQRKKMEAQSKPLHLDGKDLRQALLKNLGFEQQL